MQARDETTRTHGVRRPSYPTGNPPPYEGLSPTRPGPLGPYVGPPMHPIVYPAVVITQQMGPQSTRMTCRFCRNKINTRIEYRPTIRTHLFATFLCAMGCIPCAFVPYCVNSCQSADHFCPVCNAFMGSYNS